MTEPSPRRCILHVDMDAFFVAVELLRHPELRGKPVVVGGTGNRGVVAAASYEARRYGVHSAMPSSVARRRCPDAVFLPGDHERYGEVSSQVFAIFHDVTPLVEGISLDEAFLDVTGSLRLFGDGVSIGHLLRRRVSEEILLSCSVGVAPNKFLAKLASEAAKPVARPEGVRPGPGVVEVRMGEELAFLHPLPVNALWGVGPATLARLERFGVATVGDLAALDESVLVSALGSAHGRHLHQLAHAVDDRAVEPNRGYKSIGQEETFAHDLHTRPELWGEVVRLSDAVASRLRNHGVAARTVTLKIRFATFETITRSFTPKTPVDSGPAVAKVAGALLDEIDPTPGVRLIGVTGSNLCAPALQLDLFGDGGVDDAAVWTDASAAIDGIRERFGAAAIGPASTMRGGALRPKRQGEQQWGPDREWGQGPS